MKFLDYLFHGKELKAIGNYFKMLNGYSPTFTSFSGGVYEMDLTRTAINNFATHCSKLKPEIEGSALKSLEKTLQHKPNYFMDTTKFIKRLVCSGGTHRFYYTYRGRIRALMWLVSAAG